MDEPLHVKGHNGQITFDGRTVLVSRRGFLARATIGKGEKNIPLRAITAVQWKPAGPVMNGFIQFTIGGGNERRSRTGHQTHSASGDENSVVFTLWQQKRFAEMRSAIEAAIAAYDGNSTAAHADSSELERLASLRQSGALTEEEFAAAKAKLLGL